MDPITLRLIPLFFIASCAALIGAVRSVPYTGRAKDGRCAACGCDVKAVMAEGVGAPAHPVLRAVVDPPRARAWWVAFAGVIGVYFLTRWLAVWAWVADYHTDGFSTAQALRHIPTLEMTDETWAAGTAWPRAVLPFLFIMTVALPFCLFLPRGKILWGMGACCIIGAACTAGWVLLRLYGLLPA